MTGRHATSARTGMTLRRLAQLGALGLLVAMLAGSAMPSSALEQEGLKVAENETDAREYQPIPLFNPAPDTAAVDTSPESCRTAAWCDVIPLDVVRAPGVGPDDEYFVQVKLEWETDEIPENEVTGEARTTNDLDLYVWDDDPEAPAPRYMSASVGEPEELSMFRPVGRYWVVVANYLGFNTGYRLSAHYEPNPLPPPFELLEPVFDLPPLPAEEPLPELPVEEADEPEPVVTAPEPAPPVAAPAPPAPPAPEPTFEPVPVEADPDFADFDDSDFEDALAAPPQSDVLRERRARTVAPPEPASAPSVVFWMALVPLALAAGGGIWLARRGSGVLRIK